MNLRRFLAEAGTLVGLAVVCALVSNFLAGKERRLALPGDYPNALAVTPRAEAAPLAPFEEPARGDAPGATAVPTPEPAPTAVLPSGPATAAPVVAPSAEPASGGKAQASPAPAPAQDPAAELLARFPAHGQVSVEIGGDAAAWLHARGALFLDARRSREYAESHVAGAESFPIWESEVVRGRVEALVSSGRDARLPVVLYCSGGDCEDSHMLAQTLFGAGFENLLVYRDGLPDWVRRGGPVSTGRAK